MSLLPPLDDGARIVCSRCGRGVDPRLFRYVVFVWGERGRCRESERDGWAAGTYTWRFCGPCAREVGRALRLTLAGFDHATGLEKVTL